MGDRIDELITLCAEQIHHLATIAREAEAMRWQWERAAMEADVIVDDLLNNQRQGDYEPYYETSLGDNLIVFKRIITTAREAVKQDKR